MKKFWNWKNQITKEQVEERILELNGTIADESWFGDEVTPEIFKAELYEGNGPITIWINSPGGDCVAASQIYSMLMDYKKKNDVIVKIDGIAASAASVIAMAGTKVLMSPTSLMMIHNPITTAMGDYRDMKQAIALLGEVKESIINAYELKTNMTRDALAKLMDQETWMNAKKAIELGFADEMIGNAVTVPTEAYAFSTHECANNLLNKIGRVEPTTIKSGRKVDELKNQLNAIKKYI